MAFHGIMVLRDEGDIVAQSLAHLLTWVDSLHVYDTGSTDGTWEMVQEVASRDRRVTAVGRECVRFENGLRAMVFDRARAGYRDGDWIARLDADEFYHVSPREFVRERLGRADGRVFGQIFDFMLTRSEVAAWEAGRETLADRARPIEERRRRYVVQEFPEPRLFRYRRGMKWPQDRHMPRLAGAIARARVAVRHYRWRDPVQAAARCVLRTAMRASGARVNVHWALENWRDWVRDDADPQLGTHAPGAALPDPGLTNHLASGWRGGVQRVLYGAGLERVGDLVVGGFDRAYVPERDVTAAGISGEAWVERASFASPCTPTRDGPALRT